MMVAMDRRTKQYPPEFPPNTPESDRWKGDAEHIGAERRSSGGLSDAPDGAPVAVPGGSPTKF